MRAPQAGDYGWIVERHGALYAAEFGFDARFEGAVAAIVAAYRPDVERAWIAERAGVRCGSVLVAREDDRTARLRLLLVEPAARGAGLGRRLVRACIEFARDAGYERMVLWTHSILGAARAIYASEGFAMTAGETNDRWGPVFTSETWERML